MDELDSSLWEEERPCRYCEDGTRGKDCVLCEASYPDCCQCSWFRIVPKMQEDGGQ